MSPELPSAPPATAGTMRLARTRLRTSIEATDALERGLSLFMAELLRIKAIVEAARTPADCPLLFIADEMLRGTNARDRHTAVIAILGQLVRASLEGYFKDLRGTEPDGMYEMLVKVVEKPLLEVVMAKADHNQSKAAEWLGLNRNTLRKKLVEHRLLK